MPASGSSKFRWRPNRVTHLLGIDYPIIQAPFGGFASHQLTAKVSSLGALGSFGAVTLSGAAIWDVIAELRELTDKPFAMNLWVSASDLGDLHISAETIQRKLHSLGKYYSALGIAPPIDLNFKLHSFEDQVQAAIDGNVSVLSFIYGIPPLEILSECRRRGIKTIGTATTPKEAVLLEQAGLDLIVASGFEGGGHRGSFLQPASDSLVGSVSLIPQIVDAVSVPVIAAGGIVDARGIVAALALGAEAVQIGTAFLVCEGSGASAGYREALRSLSKNRSDLTEVFTGRLARGIRNSLMDAMEHDSAAKLPFPAQHALTQTIASPAAAKLMTLWSGQSLSLCQHTDAGTLLGHLIAQTEELIYCTVRP